MPCIVPFLIMVYEIESIFVSVLDHSGTVPEGPMAKRQRIKNQSRVTADDKTRKQTGQSDNARLPAVTAEKREKAPSDAKTRSTLLIVRSVYVSCRPP